MAEGFGGFVKGFATGLDRQLQRNQEEKSWKERTLYSAQVQDYFSQKEKERTDYAKQQSLVNSLRAAGLDESVIGYAVADAVQNNTPVKDLVEIYGGYESVRGGKVEDLSLPVQQPSPFDPNEINRYTPSFDKQEKPAVDRVETISTRTNAKPGEVNAQLTGASSNRNSDYVSNRFVPKSLTEEQRIRKAMDGIKTQANFELKMTELIATGQTDLAAKIQHAWDSQQDFQNRKQFNVKEKQDGWIVYKDGTYARVKYNEHGFQIRRKGESGQPTYSDVMMIRDLDDKNATIMYDKMGNMSMEDRQKMYKLQEGAFASLASMPTTLRMTDDAKEALKTWAGRAQGTASGKVVSYLAGISNEIKLIREALGDNVALTADEIDAYKSSAVAKIMQGAEDLNDDERKAIVATTNLAFRFLEMHGQTGRAVSNVEFDRVMSALSGGKPESVLKAIEQVEYTMLGNYRQNQFQVFANMQSVGLAEYSGLDLSVDPLTRLQRELPPDLQKKTVGLFRRYSGGGTPSRSPEPVSPAPQPPQVPQANVTEPVVPQSAAPGSTDEIEVQGMRLRRNPETGMYQRIQ